MQVDEKKDKKLDRNMYIENNKDTALNATAKKTEQLPFTEKSEVKSPAKRKKNRKA
jgi:hypothetical protein